MEDVEAYDKNGPKENRNLFSVFQSVNSVRDVITGRIHKLKKWNWNEPIMSQPAVVQSALHETFVAWPHVT